MTLVVMIFFFEGAAYNVVFIREILQIAGKSELATTYLIIFNTLWGLALLSYFQAHSSDPGIVPDRWHKFVQSMGDALPVAVAKSEWQPGLATWCKTCGPRPERSHHCSLCGICVLRMDHHCPWICNCVGIGNHKFFLLLIVYAFLASFFFVKKAVAPEIRLHVTSLGQGSAGLANELEDLPVPHL